MRSLFWVIKVYKMHFFWRENRLDKTMLYNIFSFRILTLFVLFARSFLHFSSFILAIFYHFGQFHGIVASLFRVLVGRCDWHTTRHRCRQRVAIAFRRDWLWVSIVRQKSLPKCIPQSFLCCKIRQERPW